MANYIVRCLEIVLVVSFSVLVLLIHIIEVWCKLKYVIINCIVVTLKRDR